MFLWEHTGRSMLWIRRESPGTSFACRSIHRGFYHSSFSSVTHTPSMTYSISANGSSLTRRPLNYKVKTIIRHKREPTLLTPMLWLRGLDPHDCWLWSEDDTTTLKGQSWGAESHALHSSPFSRELSILIDKTLQVVPKPTTLDIECTVSWKLVVWTKGFDQEVRRNYLHYT